MTKPSQVAILFNKPDEVLCQFTDSRGRRTLADYIQIPGIYAAGRLDYRSEGLLLLTSEGPLIHRLTDPRYQHPKTYLVQVEGVIDDQSITTLNTRLMLPDLQTSLPHAEAIPPPNLPERPRLVRGYHPTSWLSITLTEGKKHQVRRMTAAAGFPTLRLIRVATAGLTLGDLQPGEWRWLSITEVNRLYSTLNLKREIYPRHD